MRLIDVYNFLKQYSDQVPGDTVDAIDLRLALLKEPVVEAIPIEWIKKWKEKAANGSLLYRSPLDLYDHYEYEAAIDRLLSDWEEENGLS